MTAETMARKKVNLHDKVATQLLNRIVPRKEKTGRERNIIEKVVNGKWWEVVRSEYEISHTIHRNISHWNNWVTFEWNWTGQCTLRWKLKVQSLSFSSRNVINYRSMNDIESIYDYVYTTNNKPSWQLLHHDNNNNANYNKH